MIVSFALALLSLFSNNTRTLENPEGLVATNELPFENDEIDIHQQALENPDLVGGDMLIPHDLYLGNGIADERYRWPGATIPYVIDKSLSGIKNLIIQSMNHIQSNTCVKFKQRTNERSYVRIYKGVGCFATVGKNDTHPQPQPLSLGKGCHVPGTITHELLHSCGFYHEQNRSDRDEFLTIYWNNIRPNMKANFNKLQPSQNILYTGFDYESIMIYGNYAFSKNPKKGLKTMEAKNGTPLKNPHEKQGMTQSDIQRVNAMYKC